MAKTVEQLVAKTDALSVRIAQEFKKVYDIVGGKNLTALSTEERTSLIAALNGLHGKFTTLKQTVDALQASGGITESRANELINAKVTAQITEFEDKIKGGQLAEEMDTLKELADNLTSVMANGSVHTALVETMTKLGDRITVLESTFEYNFVTKFEEALNA